MKKFILAAAITACMGTVNTVQADEMLTKICQNAAAGNVGEFKDAVKATRTTLRDLYPQLQCNGQTLLSFAMQSDNPTELAEYIIKRTKRKHLRTIDGVPATEWFINAGFEGHVVFKKLMSKLG